MKTILVTTDFSLGANNAARYAIQLAKGLKAGITLCNAFKVPAEAPMAAQIAWPLEDYDSLKSETLEELRLLAEVLTEDELSNPDAHGYHPTIDYTAAVGTVSDVARNLVENRKLSMVVMGMSGAGMISRMVLGSNSHDMIEKANFPVFLIPPAARFNGIHKIAFATDLSTGDMEVIHSLAGLAYPFNAEILLAHVTDEKYDDPKQQHKVDSFLNDITCKMDYPRIYYRHIKSMDVEHGLDWLAEHGQIDILAMMHRRHNIFEQIFKGSHTQHMARRTELPLLVFPVGYHSVI